MAILVELRSRRFIRDIEKLSLAFSGPGMAAAIHQVLTTPVRTSTTERFMNEGDDAVGEWRPLTKSTINMRRAQGYPDGPINVRTGELRAWAGSGEFDTVKMGSSFVQMRYPAKNPTGDLLAKVQTAQGNNKEVPARPVLSWTKNDLAAMMVGMSKWIEGLV